MTDKDTPRRAQVDKSGYAFNLAIEAAIRNSTSQQMWRCQGIEVPWSSSLPARSGFVDVVISRDQAVGIIECKKVKEGEYLVFLTENQRRNAVTRCRLEVYFQRLEANDSAFAMPEMMQERFGAYDCEMATPSPESVYCVPPHDKRKVLNLDTIASELLESCEGLLGNWGVELPAEYVGAIPIIVTNAPIYTCEFDPRTIDLGTGNIPEDAVVTQHEFVRFRKAFGSGSGVDSPDSVKLNRVPAHQERTVFVVDSRHLVRFLSQLRGIMHAQGKFQLDDFS